MKALIMAVSLLLASSALTQPSLADDLDRAAEASTIEKGYHPDLNHQICVTVWVTWCWNVSN